jgi:hypothetical protein
VSARIPREPEVIEVEAEAEENAREVVEAEPEVALEHAS